MNSDTSISTVEVVRAGEFSNARRRVGTNYLTRFLLNGLFSLISDVAGLVLSFELACGLHYLMWGDRMSAS